jgi:hypothetical protein
MITQYDTACDRDCMHCNPVRLADHVNRKRGKAFARRRERNYKPANMTQYARRAGKAAERGRSRARLRRQDLESAPLRDTPWMRWSLWSWD